jgi:hypothetical protein
MKLSLMRAMYGDPDLLAEDIGYRGFNISVSGTKYDPDKTGVINTAEIAYSATKWALKKATSKAMTILLEKADPNVRRIIQRARKFAKSREQAASVILGGDGYYSLFESIYNSGDPAKKANLSRCLGIFKDPHGMTVDPDPPLSLIKQGCEELKIAAAIAVYREMEQTISYVYNPQLREENTVARLSSISSRTTRSSRSCARGARPRTTTRSRSSRASGLSSATWATSRSGCQSVEALPLRSTCAPRRPTRSPRFAPERSGSPPSTRRPAPA